MDMPKQASGIMDGQMEALFPLCTTSRSLLMLSIPRVASYHSTSHNIAAGNQSCSLVYLSINEPHETHLLTSASE